MIGRMVNVDELDWLGKQLESFDRYELLQFNAAAERFDVSSAGEMIDLSLRSGEVTVISDFNDLEKVGRRHYLNVYGACDPEELDALDGAETAQKLIADQPGYVPGYIDEGISGTSTKKRDSFLRMIQDAKDGRFDFIITKEISRFSRSTLDSIQYTQELLEHDVGVLFQNDNINTLDPDSEFRLAVMAGVAQDEVRKLSERLKFGFRQAIKNGHVLGNDRLWGYDKSGCVLTVNEAEAQVVRRIFDLYANQQLGIRRISQILFDEGFTSRQGNAFNVLTIRHILCNPKYKGWYCGSKSQTVDYRSERKVFLDESEWVMYPDPSVPAIVPEELWDRANALYKARSKQMQAHASGADFHNRYP